MVARMGGDRTGRTRHPAVPEGATKPRWAAPQRGRTRRTARSGPGWWAEGRRGRVWAFQMQRSSFRVRSEREEIPASRRRSCPPEATSRL
ncbi:hypothetical protein Esi_0261_0009 [Ectocarpus siliculosus]|uniref:Uncharacterized protein n=1 Tax=Ectocarpus siliculosus TaxID=2880 RepID=D7FTX2_ECTSI|nr:hypothetical protein Esi_0261_0009 [Ectocarpus siliculosus]|eukprot:CBJ31499.1 hypothetical protein Esi_0261_0009 [Ectocarpus siliculosus]